MSDVTRYRWSRAYGLRFLGGATIVLAVLWVVAALSGFAAWSLVVLAVAVLAVLACLIRFVSVPPVLLEVSSEGYRVTNVRGSGVAAAAWGEVEAVTAGRPAGSGRVMVIQLTGGRSSVVPLGLLGHRAVVAEREMHTRLNSAFGYRRLSGS